MWNAENYFGLVDVIYADKMPQVEAMAESNDFYDYQLYSNIGSGSALGPESDITNTIDWLQDWYNTQQTQNCQFTGTGTSSATFFDTVCQGYAACFTYYSNCLAYSAVGIKSE